MPARTMMQSDFWAINVSVSPSTVWLLPPGMFFSDCNDSEICNGITSSVTNYNVVTTPDKIFRTK